MDIRTPEDSTPLVDYADFHLWGNPEENVQYQVKLVRVTPDFGVINRYSYMNKWRTLPKQNTPYHIFSAAGLEPGFWNFMNHTARRQPLDRWYNVGELARYRGFQLDMYTTKGYQYSRSHCWVMRTYDGLTLFAVQKLNGIPLPVSTDLYFRCYTPSISVTTGDLDPATKNNPFVYESMLYANPTEMAVFMERYSFIKGKPGFTGVFHNGVYFAGGPNAIPSLAVGDVVEIWHDPTVIRTESYPYKDLMGFYSDLDLKRKVILHPARVKGDFTIRYFDDNDYLLMGPKGRGLYYHRNDVKAIRQLTHVDVALADDMLRTTATFHPELNDIQQDSVMVLVRSTDWTYQWPNDHQRIRYLYRMPDGDIMKAFTGARANMLEWTATELESGSVMSFTRKQWKRVKAENAVMAVGYNAATRAQSEALHRVTYKPGQRGIDVPVTYQGLMTAWEYDNAGQLIGFYNFSNVVYYSAVNPNCAMVEFVVGKAGRKLDYDVTNGTFALDPVYGFRVFVSSWSVTTSSLVGPLKDVTGDSSIYVIENGNLIWKKLDAVNQRGVIYTERTSLAYSFKLNHIDKSLDFALTTIYEDGGLIFPFSLAEVDVFLNGHPLIDKVDWIFKDQYIHIHNREFMVDGAQTITVRAYGFHDDMTQPNKDRELGFVDGGVIGRFARYNLRADRVTRVVIGGGLFVSDEVPRAERSVPGNQWNLLNGRPYMVKHSRVPIAKARPFDAYPERKRSRETDQRVSDYLTQWLPKPIAFADEIWWENGKLLDPPVVGSPVVPNLLDRYRLYSPFMNVVVNAILNGYLDVPDLQEGDTAFSGQDVAEAVKPYLWRLEFDPIPLNYDRRYFAITPFANIGKQTVTSKELLFINQVNDLYLSSVLAIEGYFEVSNV